MRNASRTGPTVRIWRELERRVFALLNTSQRYPQQLMHRTPRGVWIGNVPADALLYDQNMLDWNIVGELTGDREYIGRGFVPTTRTLNDTEKEQIKWKSFSPEGSTVPPGVGHPGATYTPGYVLRYLEYGGMPPQALPKERMLKAPPWLFSAESDVYKNPWLLSNRAAKFAGERVTANFASLAAPPPPR